MPLLYHPGVIKQIIHNILDIQKILGLYINDIIYVIDNLQGDIRDESKLVNILGESLSTNKVKEYLERITDYLGLFDSAFEFPKPKEKKEIIEAKREERQKHNIGVLRLLGAVRLCTSHFKNSAFLFAPLDGLNKTLQKEFKSEYKSEFTTEWSIIEQHYIDKINNINEKFLKNAEMNLQIIFETLKINDEMSRKEIAKQYYEFSILKKGKNLGVNMRNLRELTLTNFDEIKNKKHDSYRKKLYTIIDFLLYRRFYNSAELNEIVLQLRKTPNDTAKEQIYKFFSRFAIGIISPFINNILPTITKYFDDKKKNKLNFTLDESWFTEVQINPNNTTPLTKLLSFLCNFWEGKEINELLSAYIHKFENIQTFINTLKELGEEVKFAEKYALFNEANNEYAGRIANELRILASIGKMKPDLEGAKRQLCKAAIETLGVPDDSNKLSDEWIDENIMAKDQTSSKHPLAFRNFLLNNVIKSRRFMYLVRYTKPKTARALMQNRKIVHYVLSRIADIKDVHIHGSQIDKYYLNLPNANEKENDKNRKIDALADYLVNFSFDTLLKNKKGIITNTKCLPAEKNIEIEHLKALTGLYLTVAYIALKNIVKTNARYYIAFAAFDRDHSLFAKKLELDEKTDKTFFQTISYKDKKRKEQTKNVPVYFAVTEYFLDQDDKIKYIPDPNLSDAENKKILFKFLDSRKNKRHFTKKKNNILRNNINEAQKIQETGGLLVEVRNHAEHLNVLMNLEKYVGDFRKNSDKPMQSYFELYHYVLQRMMIEPEYLKAWNIDQFVDDIKKYHTPSHDWIKYAYVSLGYNLPRYKNLTCEALFDADSEPGKVLTDKWKQMDEEKKKKRNN
jgi:hypothetical protein